jgi:hypothetical protein
MSGLAFLDALDGARIPGGCDTCNAYQDVDATHAPVYRLVVSHDDDCVTYRAMRKANQ